MSANAISQDKAQAMRICLATGRACLGDEMRRTILTLAGAGLIAASTTQMAAAAQPHRSQKADRAPMTTNEQFRDSNAAWPAAQPDWSRYSSGGLSAPAGR
jgi:hypothetical protein